MQREELQRTFDQQAASYDQQWSKLAAIRDALHLLLGAVFADLPEDARVLCVGAGTGAETFFLARRFPKWKFVVVEPSSGMIEVCRRRAEEQEIAPRCVFHEGYLESLPATGQFHAGTCLLVSQFILQRESRIEFFRGIAERLHSGATLVSSDLSYDVNSSTYDNLLEVWLRLMKAGDIPPEGIERIRAAYSRDVAILPPLEVESILTGSGFERPIRFFQAGLIHAWYSKRTKHPPENET